MAIAASKISWVLDTEGRLGDRGVFNNNYGRGLPLWLSTSHDAAHIRKPHAIVRHPAPSIYTDTHEAYRRVLATASGFEDTGDG
jgi:hypothetical protein